MKSPLSIACILTLVGLIAFIINWNLWEFFNGPMPGYQILLFPGNLTLEYFWHPIFTEEVTFWPKLLMLMVGQFFIVWGIALVINLVAKKYFS